jgi:hypothetical protein
MNNLERAQYLADFAKDNCEKCDCSNGICHENGKIEKCLRSDHIVGRLGQALYTVRPDFALTDFRHWNFEDDFTVTELSEILRRNG